MHLGLLGRLRDLQGRFRGAQSAPACRVPSGEEELRGGGLPGETLSRHVEVLQGGALPAQRVLLAGEVQCVGGHLGVRLEVLQVLLQRHRGRGQVLRACTVFEWKEVKK